MITIVVPAWVVWLVIALMAANSVMEIWLLALRRKIDRQQVEIASKVDGLSRDADGLLRSAMDRLANPKGGA